MRRSGYRGGKDRDDGRGSIRVGVWRWVRGRDLSSDSLSSSLGFLLSLYDPGLLHGMLG